jgi:tetratricopeptide (TPR) repeat protein
MRDAMVQSPPLPRRTRRAPVLPGQLAVDTSSWVAQAWALKDACYAAWSTDPAKLAADAAHLRQLSDRAQALPAGALAADRRQEILALAEWTEGLACITRGRMQHAAAGLDRAALAFRNIGQERHAALTQVPKIMALSMLGHYDEAAACAESAQRELESLGDAQAAAKVGLNLGALSERRGNYAEAARHSRRAAVLFARSGDPEHSVMADINLANALTSMGDFDEGLRIYARAHMRAGAHGFPVLQALADEAMALVRLARGEYRDALAGFEAARRAYERLDMPQHLAIAEKQLADAYLELRLLPEAVALFDQALDRLQQLDVPDEQAWTFAQRGRALALLGERSAASTSFERAEHLFAEQGIGVGEAAVMLARAELALASGDAMRAKALAEKAGQSFDEAERPDGSVRAALVLSHALLQAHEWTAAEAALEGTLAHAQRLQMVSTQVGCHVGRGALARAQGRTEDARAAWEEAVALFEDQRQALPGDELRSAFLADHLQPYQDLLRLAVEAWESDPVPAKSAAVLEQLERVRARGLLDRSRGAEVVAGDAGVQALRNRWNWLQRRVQRLQDEGEPVTAMLQALHQTERDLLERARRARLADAPLPEQPDAGPGMRPFEVAALQVALRPDEALVEYGLLGDELLACVVTRAEVSLHRRLGSWAEVLEALRATRFQIETLRHGQTPVAAHLEMLSRRTQIRLERLHSALMAPLASRLADSRRLLIVPCGMLAALPFGALSDGRQALSQTHDLALVPSARLALRGLARAAARPVRVLALGESQRLPHAGTEAREVAALFPQGQAWVGADASLAVLQREAPRADVIHLACHAAFRTDNPLFSALHLHDAALSVEQIGSLKLQSSVVVLSACETGLSAQAGGDEQIGLVRAFLAAGASRVIASLWPVEDRITARFMQLLYAALLTGQAPATALRTAQAQLRQDHPHPFHWAAFVLHGGW